MISLVTDTTGNSISDLSNTLRKPNIFHAEWRGCSRVQYEDDMESANVSTPHPVCFPQIVDDQLKWNGIKVVNKLYTIQENDVG